MTQSDPHLPGSQRGVLDEPGSIRTFWTNDSEVHCSSSRRVLSNARIPTPTWPTMSARVSSANSSAWIRSTAARAALPRNGGARLEELGGDVVGKLERMVPRLVLRAVAEGARGTEAASGRPGSELPTRVHDVAGHHHVAATKTARGSHVDPPPSS